MVLKNGHKMSKSVGNTVDPNALIDHYGADTARLFVMFAAPPEQSLEWSDAGVEGSHRFLKRLWAFCQQHHAIIQDVNGSLFDENASIDWQRCDNRLKKARYSVHQILLRATHDYERQQFNTVVSGCMKLFNEISNYSVETEDDKYFIQTSTSFLLRLLAPITPHLCHVLWQQLGFEKAIIDAPWPKCDKSALKTEEADFFVQINGKLRAQFVAKTELDEENLIRLATEQASAFLQGQTIKKSIVVAHRRLINLVVTSA